MGEPGPTSQFLPTLTIPYCGLFSTLGPQPASPLAIPVSLEEMSHTEDTRRPELGGESWTGNTSISEVEVVPLTSWKRLTGAVMAFCSSR